MKNIVEKVLKVSGENGYDNNGKDFDLLRDAILTADLAGPLSDDKSSLTVFAPNDNAFVGLAKTLGYDGSDEAGSLAHIIDALTLLGGGDPIPLLTQILTYHVTPGEFFLADVANLGDGAKIPTLQGGELTLDLGTPGLGDLDPGLSDPELIGFDINVSNGVIHVLDGVLLPLSVSEILSQKGTDFEIGSNSNENFDTGGGKDFIDGNGGKDIIRAGSKNDVAIGGNGNDLIFGQRGSDTLLGENGSDKISGGNGRDIINGGKGQDRLIGGNGEDTFIFRKSSGKDSIKDFTDDDTIQIESGANRMKDLDFTDTKAGLLVEFGNVDIFLEDLDRKDVSSSDFDFV